MKTLITLTLSFLLFAFACTKSKPYPEAIKTNCKLTHFSEYSVFYNADSTIQKLVRDDNYQFQYFYYSKGLVKTVTFYNDNYFDTVERFFLLNAKGLPDTIIVKTYKKDIQMVAYDTIVNSFDERGRIVSQFKISGIDAAYYYYKYTGDNLSYYAFDSTNFELTYAYTDTIKDTRKDFYEKIFFGMGLYDNSVYFPPYRVGIANTYLPSSYKIIDHLYGFGEIPMHYQFDQAGNVLTEYLSATNSNATRFNWDCK